jgi:16S rRNA (guanine527-N7)-methyltransferase
MKNSQLNNLLTIALQQNHLSLTDQAQQQLIHYLELLQTWNRVYNLTSITNPSDMVSLHLIDSLMVQPFLHGTRLLDVGSGAGLPGIPLAIVNPHQTWVLLDKNNKKTRFMTQAIAELGLKNAEAIQSRCEDFHPQQCFDSILSRAFGTIRLFVESTSHLLCDQGRFIAMKGKYPQDEIDDLPSNIILQKSERLDIKGINAERHIICLSRGS